MHSFHSIDPLFQTKLNRQFADAACHFRRYTLLLALSAAEFRALIFKNYS
jgi:hypothetical protein